jgi:GGDEF domain-containing protein
MGVAEARRYIEELHKKQENPYLWPDYLTGLPDKAAIIRKLEEVFPRLGKLSVAYVRLANIHPYLVKYGPDKHAEVIQWAAAILKTTCEKCENCFVGTLSTHDFVVMCDASKMAKHLKDAAGIFRKKAEMYYANEDLKNKAVMSFSRNGKTVNIGLMKLVSVIVDKKPPVEKKNLFQHMGRVCEAMESGGDDITVMTRDMFAG